jgi:hypothetical protein
MEKIGGRKPGVRNRISHKFLENLHAEWERSGEAALKIMAVEQPSEFAKLVGSLLPKQTEIDAPSLVVVATGVPRHGESYAERPPRIPLANVPALAPGEDEFQED